MQQLIQDWRGLYESMLDGLANPAQLHALMTHLPIAAALMGLLVVLLLVVTRGRSWGARAAAALIYLVGVVSALVTAETGERAHDFSREAGAVLSPAAISMLHRHEEMAEKLWIFMAVTAVLVVLTALPRAWMRWGATALALVAALACVGWVGAIGHYGGTMVYEQGVGVPVAESNLPADAMQRRRAALKIPANESPPTPQSTPKPDETSNGDFFGVPVP